MPYLLLSVGCFLFIISMLLLFIPAFHVHDLNAVIWMSQHRTDSMNNFATVLSTIGGMPGVLFLATLWCLCLTWYKKYTNIVFIVTGLSGSFATAWLLKFVFSRPRPPEMYHLVESYGASFPSAHSFYAATLGCLAIYLSMKHTAHKLIFLCALIWILMMGVSRVYLGVHYPTDVLSGWSISFIWISLLYLLFTQNSKVQTND
ncbi:phosphatase PAP2 family protein [Acinetobacter chinensis]|uniref:undecaprenyl-diphosphate phosphatase n=1 Tax=Acinetobacter chinensis TaxID=2004650 RepID=A0A3B7LTJ7_9GAMM|nr:phosphatase PAP2 family protein [Acinetobacter chinensis]AXY56036.1 phosphatase PAP2 family protein [Acinetobacter chinensis]MDV2470052.1 phosphatase PAP2 family protein [Acinetobacter chinensis]